MPFDVSMDLLSMLCSFVNKDINGNFKRESQIAVC